MNNQDHVFFSFIIALMIFVIGLWLVVVMGVPASAIFLGSLLFGLLWVIVEAVLDLLS